jgi:predicted nucleic acid-binding protein
MQNSQLLIIDNSVLSKPLFNENGAAKVRKLLNLKDNFKISIFVPEIFRYEFFNAATRKKGASVAKKAYNKITERQFSIISFESDLIEMTSRLMTKYPKITFYDASYHALAKAYNGIFVTADEKYYELTKKEGNIKLLDEMKI